MPQGWVGPRAPPTHGPAGPIFMSSGSRAVWTSGRPKDLLYRFPRGCNSQPNPKPPAHQGNCKPKGMVQQIQWPPDPEGTPIPTGETRDPGDTREWEEMRQWESGRQPGEKGRALPPGGAIGQHARHSPAQAATKGGRGGWPVRELANRPQGTGEGTRGGYAGGDWEPPGPVGPPRRQGGAGYPRGGGLRPRGGHY